MSRPHGRAPEVRLEVGRTSGGRSPEIEPTSGAYLRAYLRNPSDLRFCDPEVGGAPWRYLEIGFWARSISGNLFSQVRWGGGHTSLEVPGDRHVFLTRTRKTEHHKEITPQVRAFCDLAVTTEKIKVRQRQIYLQVPPGEPMPTPTVRARLEPCPRCHTATLYALDSHTAGMPARVDPLPLDAHAELDMRLAGRMTYDLIPTSGRHHLSPREYDLTRRRYPVLATHTCPGPIPATAIPPPTPAKKAPPTDQPTLFDTPEEDQCPF